MVFRFGGDRGAGKPQQPAALYESLLIVDCLLIQCFSMIRAGGAGYI